MNRKVWITLLIGIFLFCGVLAWQGVGAVMAGLKEAGWKVLLLPLYSLIPLFFAVMAWSTLFKGKEKELPVRKAFFPGVVGLAINWLLPSAQVGGEVARAHLNMQAGYSAHQAVAAGMVDKTMQLLTQVLFTVVGLILILLEYSGGSVAVGITAGIICFSGVVAALFWVQNRGVFQLLAKSGNKFRSITGDLSDQHELYDGEVRSLYANTAAVIRCGVFRMIFRILMVGEVWLAMHFIGHPVGLKEALILESLAQAIRVGAFFIPAGVGAQEGGLAVLGVILGLTPEACVTLALCKRVRELMVGVPFLLVWQSQQGKRILKKVAGPKGAD